jgi:hypothetical protein
LAAAIRPSWPLQREGTLARWGAALLHPFTRFHRDGEKFG